MIKKRNRMQERKNERQNRIRYDTYTLTFFDILKAILVGEGAAVLAAYLLYETYIALLPLSILPLFCIWKYKEMKLKQQKKNLRTGFMTFLESLSVLLAAGYSTENAIMASRKELAQMYGQESSMAIELQYMSSQLNVSVTPEELFLELAHRSGLTEIENFAAVYSSARRTGGDMGKVVKRTYRMMHERSETEKEIEATLSARKAEHRLMCVMPVGILLYLKLTSPGFLSSMYGNPAGIAVMTGCLLMYSLAICLGNRIVEIHL